jgi:hypothetical protein
MSRITAFRPTQLLPLQQRSRIGRHGPRPKTKFLPILSEHSLLRSRSGILYSISALDTAPEWTLDQIAGLVFGGFLVALYFSSKFIDEYVAISQRRQLDICEQCGGLNAQETCQENDCPYKQ